MDRSGSTGRAGVGVPADGATDGPDGVWDRVVGQDRAVAVLRRAAAAPAHAYLLSGPPGAGLDDAARSFAAALLCPEGGCGHCSACERALRARHPDLVEVEPEGTQMRVGQAAAVIETAFRTPVEGNRKVIVLREAERMNERTQNKLLKTFEEPPEATVFVILTNAPDDLLDTVRSRCQQVTLRALETATVVDALVASGIDAAAAARVARLAGGRIDRARLLVGDYADLRSAFAGAPARLDGTGAAAGVIAADLLEAVEGAFAAVKGRHEDERRELDADADRAGYPDQVVRRLRKALEERHKRAEQRARQDALADGISALEAVYRDALVGGDAALDPDGPDLGLSPPACLAAIDACAGARRRVQEGVVLNWGLLLEHLLLHLPPVAGTATGTGTEAT